MGNHARTNSGRKSRRKGQNGEREVRDILRQHGFQADREARQWGDQHEDLIHDLPRIHLEVRRREKVEITKWMRETAEESNGKIPVVAHRRSRENWLATVPLEWLVGVLAEARENRRSRE